MTKPFLALAGLAIAAHASALQPLEAFLRGAQASSPDNAEARAARRQLRAESDAVLGLALPRLSLRGSYTRNEVETILPFPSAGGGTADGVLTPQDQLDGALVLDVPLVDLSTFGRVAAARTGVRAASEEARATGLRVQAGVSRDYHRLVASAALVDSARRALEVARESLRIAESRHEAGTVPSLDVDRARAEVERNVQALASAELQVSLAARALESVTGVTPALDGAVTLADDLREEPPLERFQAPDDALPELAAAIQSRVASEQEVRARRLALLPSVGASLVERATDFEGFGGPNAQWQALAVVRWSFDLTTLAAIRAQEAAAERAGAREHRTRLAARDAIHAAWATVRTNVARSRSARVQAEVSARAAALALERYEAGEATQLDLLQAQRDAFAADAARIQADADLVDSRAQLRLAAGQNLLARNSTEERR